MRPKTQKSPESVVREIKRKTRRKFTSEEKIRIILEGLRGEDSISAICRREGIALSVYYKWSKTFLEAGKRRLRGDTVREAGRGRQSANCPKVAPGACLPLACQRPARLFPPFFLNS